MKWEFIEGEAQREMRRLVLWRHALLQPYAVLFRAVPSAPGLRFRDWDGGFIVTATLIVP